MEQDPYRVVWPVKPNSRIERYSAATGTGVGDTQRDTDPAADRRAAPAQRRGLLDPATGTQPGNARRTGRTHGTANVDQARTHRYQPTAYVSDEVLISVNPGAARTTSASCTRGLNAVAGAGRRTCPGIDPARCRSTEDLARARRIGWRPTPSRPYVIRVGYRLIPAAVNAAGPPDAWNMVQILRDLLAPRGPGPRWGTPDEQTCARSLCARGVVEIGLNHLMFATELGGVGFSVGHSVSYGHRLQLRPRVQLRPRGQRVRRARPGRPNAGPVIAAPPASRAGLRSRCTAVPSSRSWTPAWPRPHAGSTSTDGTTRSSQRYVYDPDACDRRDRPTDDDGGETEPNLIDPLEGLIDPFFGHGTFIAGLVRQTAPTRDLLSVKLMGNDGIVEEADLINALGSTCTSARSRPGSRRPTAELIDVVSLSLGYYSRGDPTRESSTTAMLREAVDALAGSASSWSPRPGTTPPTRPAARGVHALPRRRPRAGWRSPAPLVSVGALNPDGSIALFSNGGDGSPATPPAPRWSARCPMIDVGQRSGIDVGRPGPVRPRGRQLARDDRPRQLRRLRDLERYVVRGPARRRLRWPRRCSTTALGARG